MPQRYAFFLIYANICIILYKKAAPKGRFLEIRGDYSPSPVTAAFASFQRYDFQVFAPSALSF